MSTRPLVFALDFALVLTLALPARAAPADRVELRTGEVIVGKILKKTRDEVSIQIQSGGILTFKTAHVRSVRRSGGEGADEEDSQAEKKEAASGDPVESGKGAKKAGDADPAAPRAGGTAGPPGTVQGAPRPPPSARGPGAQLAGPAPAGPAPPVGTPGAGLGAEAAPEERLVTDAQRGFAVAPPGGFAPWPEGKAPTVILAYQDPFTRATFTVASYASQDATEEVKKRTVQSYSEVFAAFSVIRNEKLKQAGKEVAPEAWLVEMESRYGTLVTHQLQVFSKKGEDVFLLTYTASDDMYSRYRESFERSLATFRFLEAGPPPR